MEQEVKNKKVNINKTWIIVAVLVVITGVLLIVSLNARNSMNNPSGSKQVKTGFANSILSVSDQIRTGSASGTYEADINIDSKDNKITVAQIEMSYDPKALGNVDIKPGTFLQNPVVLAKNVDPGAGRIKFWIAIPPSATGVKGQGTLAVVSFSKFGNTPTNLNFLPKTSLAASGIDQSVLKKTISGLIGAVPTPISKSTNQYLISPAKNQ